MMGIAAIKEINREAATVAAREGKRPLVLSAEDWRDDLEHCHRGVVPPHLKNLPHLAPEYVDDLYPGRYRLVESFFVDKTGYDLWDAFGPALSVGELCERGVALTADHGAMGWTIHDEGQFQLYASCYRLVGGNGHHASSAEPVTFEAADLKESEI